MQLSVQQWQRTLWWGVRWNSPCEERGGRKKKKSYFEISGMTVQALSTFIRGNLWQENPTPKKMKSLKYRLKKHEVTITVSESPRVLVLKLRWSGIYYCHLLLAMLWYCDLEIVALPSVFHNIWTSLMSCCVGIPPPPSLSTCWTSWLGPMSPDDLGFSSFPRPGLNPEQFRLC